MFEAEVCTIVSCVLGTKIPEDGILRMAENGILRML